ncbi:MAG TPA: DHH family phosphoesterase [Lachnospiraceae bacterium]|nr:DHH family phosphoesterase [Lachnospiraceae bacterium]HBB59367.1 DHH family phosphoesterase [Lachnospiraceae bacterium]
MKKRFKQKRLMGSLRLYTGWPIILSVYLTLAAAGIFFVNRDAGLIAIAAVIIYIIIALIIRFSNKSAIAGDMVNFATSFGQVQKGLLKGLPLPYALLDDTGRFIWCNNEFCLLIGRDVPFGRSITSIVPELTKDKLPKGKENISMSFSIEGRDFKADIRCTSMDDMGRGSLIIDDENFTGSLITIFLFDETEVNDLKRINIEQKNVCGYIYLDNYDEVMENVEEVRRSLLTALIDRKIKKYFADYDAVVKNTEKDRYFITMKRLHFDRLVENRFDILEDVKTVKIGNEMSVTLSMGFGMDGRTLIDDAEYARSAIDLALGRGGDQAVVKASDKTTYFGGKSQQIEKNTRVKARVKAHALGELIEQKERVFCMGHQITDIDSFGAAVGIYRATRQLDRKCHIVINTVTQSIRPFVDAFSEDPDYEPDMFVTSAEALSMADSDTSVLVVVDTNKPSITECPDLLRKLRTIVVLDHHRVGTETVENATLSYIEPFASSACEMVAEILQYISDNIRIKSVEADSLYAGIMIDTNNFMAKAGVRTFEAAAFLRRSGADITRVRKLFRNDIDAYKARAEIVKRAELYLGKYAVSTYDGNSLESPTVVGSQAANELLNINFVKASFVLTEYQGRIYISARSIDEVNVQMIMERFGGGGHMNIAGAQLSDISLDGAREKLEEIIDDMEKEGALG